MNAVVPPLCLVLSLVLFIAGFVFLAVEPPQPSVELHRARVEADEAYREALEQQLDRRRLARKLWIGCLFGLAVVTAVAGFVTMRPAVGR